MTPKKPHGRPTKGLSKKEHFTLRLDPWVLGAIQDQAAAEGIKAAKVIHRVLAEYALTLSPRPDP